MKRNDWWDWGHDRCCDGWGRFNHNRSLTIGRFIDRFLLTG